MRIIKTTIIVMLSQTKHYYHSFSPFVKLRVTDYKP